MSFVVIAVVQVINLILQLALRDGGDGTRVVLSVITTLLSGVARLVLAGALVVVIGEAVLGRKVSISAALNRLKGRVWPLIGLALLVGLLTVVALLGLIVGAIYVGVLLALSTPAFILEQQTVTAAMRRSRDLVRGSWWRIFGILLLGGIIAVVISGIISVPFVVGAGASEGLFSGNSGAGTADLSAGSLVLLAVGSIISGTLVAPITAGIAALLYVDQRMRREGLDLTLAQAAHESGDHTRSDL
jgi:hypothetical protein